MQSHLTAKQRREALIAAGRVEQRPLEEWCGEYGFGYCSAASHLRRACVPFKGIRGAKAEKMLALHGKGLDCAAIAKEMGLSGARYVYRRLLDMGASPSHIAQPGNMEIGGKRMSRDVPRILKMVGDLKRGLSTADMQAKYGVCRERVSQVRAYGIAAGLLENQT